MPKITVGLPIYNEQKHISEAIESLKGQTYADFDVFISDNCSTDATSAICREKIGNDRRFRFSSHSRNLGAASNFEHAFRVSDREYFAWLGGHDFISHDFLKTLSFILDESNQTSMAFCDTCGIDGLSNEVRFPRCARAES